jgi:hypothetical protein
MLLTAESKSTSACKIAFSVSLIFLTINSAFLRGNQGDLSRVSYSIRANHSTAFSLELGPESKMISPHAEITWKKRKPAAAAVANGAAESALDELRSDAVAEGD